jgi:hypothetical protein
LVKQNTVLVDWVDNFILAASLSSLLLLFFKYGHFLSTCFRLGLGQPRYKEGNFFWILDIDGWLINQPNPTKKMKKVGFSTTLKHESFEKFQFTLSHSVKKSNKTGFLALNMNWKKIEIYWTYDTKRVLTFWLKILEHSKPTKKNPKSVISHHITWHHVASIDIKKWIMEIVAAINVCRINWKL